MRIIIIFAAMMMGAPAWAAKIEDKEFPDTLSITKKNLVLNGVGLRTKKKLGMNFRVYVGGLYVAAKSTEAAKHLEPGDKVLELIFLRSLDKGTLQEAWSEGFPKNCQMECEAGAETLKQFNDLMVDVKEDSRLKMTFDKDGVSVELTGKTENKSGRINSAAFAKNIMAVFIGPQPPTEQLKKGLLGL